MTSLLQLSSDTPIPMRSISDKEMGAIDLDQLFGDYVETDLLQQFSDSTVNRSSSDDLARLFDPPSSNESDLSIGTSSISPILDRETAAAWHEALQKCEQNPTSSMSNDSSSFHVESRGKKSLSDSDLLSFEDLFELERNQLRSTSQPSTPRPHTTTRSVKKAVSFNDRSVPCGVQKLSKKSSATSFAKMMHPSHYRSPIPDIWTRKMATSADPYQLRAPPNDITSPPPSSRIGHHDNGSGFFAQDHQPYSNGRSPLTRDESHTPNMDFSNYQLTPQASPAIGVSSNNGNHFNNNMGMNFRSASSADLSALQTPPASLAIPMTTWGPETSPNIDFSFSASGEFASTGKTAGWWNDEATSTQPATAPSYRESHSRSTSQSMGAAMNGLGISCDSAAFSDFGPVGLGVSVGESMPSTQNSSFDMGSYNAVYHTSPQQHIVTIGHRPLSRSPSPCPQPHFHRRRPNSHSHPSHHRASHSSTASNRRKSSNSSQQSARQPPSGNVGFVNFTPDDSRKILTGVAPSGSSKTKARREKEAAEKRRKLSQAAMKAVIEAGGDVDSLRRLEREGLLVMES